MHECPECGQACDCLGDDTWDATESIECMHVCSDDGDDDFWFEELEDYQL